MTIAIGSALPIKPEQAISPCAGCGGAPRIPNESPTTGASEGEGSARGDGMGVAGGDPFPLGAAIPASDVPGETRALPPQPASDATRMIDTTTPGRAIALPRPSRTPR